MSSRLARLRERFKRSQDGGKRRRNDYLGKRQRVNLRVKEDIARGLEILKLANGVDKNSFCESAIGEAVDEELRHLRERLGEKEWETIVRRAGHDRKQADN